MTVRLPEGGFLPSSSLSPLSEETDVQLPVATYASRNDAWPSALEGARPGGQLAQTCHRKWCGWLWMGQNIWFPYKVLPSSVHKLVYEDYRYVCHKLNSYSYIYICIYVCIYSRYKPSQWNGAPPCIIGGIRDVLEHRYHLYNWWRIGGKTSGFGWRKTSIK